VGALASTAVVEVRGQPIRYSVGGSGRPLLLIMGIGGHLEMWRPLLEELAGVETIAFDLPGCGQSPSPRVPLRIGQLAGLVEGLLDELGYAETDVLGLSYGGFVAQQLAVRSPSRVRRLVLAATSTGAISLPPPPHNFLRMLTPARYASESYFLRVAPALYGGVIARDPSALQAHAVDRRSHAPSAGGYLSQLYSVWGWSSFLWLWRVRQPTLVLAGSDDRLVPLVNARILATGIPSAELHVVRGGGHLFLLDQPADVAPLITRFLALE
jgi:poly(3-hydroxyalkanoate) depolymerase